MIIKPMLAASVEDLSALPYPVLSFPKVDGIRCLVVDGVVASRSLKPIPNKYIQEKWGHERYNGLDGKLLVGSTMNNDVFNTTMSVVMSRDKDPSEHGGVVFSVFDYYLSPDKPYEERYGDMMDIVDGNGLAAVPYEYARSEEELLKNHSFYIRLGYEGTIVRTVDSKYKYGRSTLKQGWLLKIKDFSDAEEEG